MKQKGQTTINLDINKQDKLLQIICDLHLMETTDPNGETEMNYYTPTFYW